MVDYFRNHWPVSPEYAMGLTNARILFIDGFAGPGEYKGGEKGSPVIALETYLEHSAREKFRANVGFVFIEKEESRSSHLRALLQKYESDLPDNATYAVFTNTFDAKMEEVLDQIDEQAKNLAPAFVMIDPFGVSGTPMSVIERIFKNPKSEVYISFQYEAINRFNVTSEFKKPLDELFGTPEWRQYVEIEDPEIRKECIYRLYTVQLKRAGAKQVIKFELYEKNRLVYAVFFATKHELGADCMKKAIWKIAPWGDFIFKSPGKSQMSLGIESPDFEPLKHQLKREFSDRAWVSIKEVEDYMKSDKTLYHSGQLREYALKPLEDSEKIVIDQNSRKRRKTYPPGTRIKFLNEE